MHVTVVVNPVAGGRRPRDFNRQAIETLVARVAACAGASADVFVTTGPGAGRLGAQAALEAGADLVIAWGGDGTVNGVASVLAGSEFPMGLVPVGSGNGLARELRVPGRPRDALQLAFQRKVRVIDVGRLGERLFVNVTGFGFDAQVAYRFNQAGGRRGLSGYVRLTLAEVLGYRPRRYVVQWDGGTFEGAATIVAVANSRQYGNRAIVAPQAELDDGQLDLVVVQPTSPLRDLWRARRLFTQTILRDPLVRAARVRRVTVEGDEPLRCHVDGEPFEEGTRAKVTVQPRALRVCTRG